MDFGGLIVGLGNPGKKYSKTRHNIGFMVLESLIEHNFELGCINKQNDYLLWLWDGNSMEKPWLLCQPLTYMNLSGKAVKKVLKKYKLLPTQTLVVHDELDFPLGKLRFKFDGGLAGHKGLRSIAEHLGSHDFYRLRMGIGRPEDKTDIVDYVLSRFAQNELDCLSSVIERAILGIKIFCNQGMETAIKGMTPCCAS